MLMALTKSTKVSSLEYRIILIYDFNGLILINNNNKTFIRIACHCFLISDEGQDRENAAYILIA